MATVITMAFVVALVFIFVGVGFLLGFLIFRKRKAPVSYTALSDHEIHEIARALAHEVRTPLNTISMNIQLLSEELIESPKAKERLERVRDEIERINRLIQSFLDYTRPPAPNFRRLDINELARKVADIMKPRLTSSNIVLVEHYGQSLPYIQADPALLEQVFQNLLTNAFEASAPGGQVLIETGKWENSVFFAVADQGKGIPPELLDKVFMPYFSTKQGGVGIGMAVVRRIVEAHRGKIQIQSRVGQGTRVVIHIPVG